MKNKLKKTMKRQHVFTLSLKKGLQTFGMKGRYEIQPFKAVSCNTQLIRVQKRIGSTFILTGFYKKLKRDLIEYDLNRTSMVDVSQTRLSEAGMTVCWHVEDLKVSELDPKAVDVFLTWTKTTCGCIGKSGQLEGNFMSILA